MFVVIFKIGTNIVDSLINHIYLLTGGQFLRHVGHFGDDHAKKKYLPTVPSCNINQDQPNKCAYHIISFYIIEWSCNVVYRFLYHTDI
jgi:hypothetical protein